MNRHAGSHLDRVGPLYLRPRSDDVHVDVSASAHPEGEVPCYVLHSALRRVRRRRELRQHGNAQPHGASRIVRSATAGPSSTPRHSQKSVCGSAKYFMSMASALTMYVAAPARAKLCNPPAPADTHAERMPREVASPTGSK